MKWVKRLCEIIQLLEFGLPYKNQRNNVNLVNTPL